MLSWDIYNILAIISAYSVVIPIVFIYKKRNETRVLKLLFVYLVLSLLTESTLHLVTYYGQSNLLVVAAFKILELVLIMGLFSYSGLLNAFQINCAKTIPVIGSILLIIGFAIKWTGLFDGFEHTCIIFLSTIAFYRLFLITEEINENIHPFFWFNLAIFLYFSASFFLFLFGNLIRSFEEVAKLLWMFHLVANILFYCTLTVGIWKHKAT